MADIVVLCFLLIFGALILFIGGFMLIAGAADPLEEKGDPYDAMAIWTGQTTRPLASTPPHGAARQ